jgi:regulator of sigma E protease
MGVVLLVVGILLFIGLVVVHELGHFLVARRNGVEAEEFGIFFPPKLWSRQIKGKKGRKSFEFSINALPLGGFVRLKGEHDADTEPGTFGAATVWAKTKIMAAGVGMNLAAALVLFMILAWVGMPQLVDNQFTVKSDTKVTKSEVLIGEIQPGSPAAKAGLQQRDDLTGITPANHPGAVQALSRANNLPDVTERLAGQTVDITYIRAGVTHHVTTTLLSAKAVAASKQTKNPKGYLGVVPSEYTLQRSTWSAPIVAAGVAKQFTVLTFKGLWMALQGVGSAIAGLATSNHAAREAGQTQASNQVSGPVGIFVILKDGSSLGYQFMLMIVAVISLSLAIMNVLPIPALDGGKIFLTYMSRLFRKQLTQEFEEMVYGGSFVLLLLLIGLITIVDVQRFL